jgi:hypothetical protein
MRFVSRMCALGAGATLGAVLTMLGPGSGISAADPANPLLTEIAAQVGLPAQVWTASGTHTAHGYTSAADTNKYWFTRIDEPFTCTARMSP